MDLSISALNSSATAVGPAMQTLYFRDSPVRFGRYGFAQKKHPTCNRKSLLVQ